MTEDPVTLPDRQGGGWAAAIQGKQPDSVFVPDNGIQLIQPGNFEAVGLILFFGQFAEKLFHGFAIHQHDHHGLQIFGDGPFSRSRRGGSARPPGRQQMHGPQDLDDGDGRELFQLKLDHGEDLIEIARGKLDDLQENTFRRQAGDVELGLPQGGPGFGDELGRQRLDVGHANFPVQNVIIALGVKLPEPLRVGGEV
jgi:hypothetical protein